MKSIDLIATARSGNDANALSDAQATIRLAGRTIRYALSAHAAAVAFDQAVTDTIFDTVWSTIPGGGAIASAGQELLKAGLKAMLTGAMSRSDPAEQSQKILDEFIRSVRAARRDGHFGPGEGGVSIESDAITGFEAAMR